MKSVRQGLALFLAGVMLVSPLSVSAGEMPAGGSEDRTSGNEESENQTAGNHISENEVLENKNELQKEETEESSAVKQTEDGMVDKETADLSVYMMDEVCFNTGNHEYRIVNAPVSGNVIGDGCFGEDGSYTINIPEENPFFPYEVQFTYQGETASQWFMTPEDSVEIGGHTFYVSAYFDNTAITQMSLNIAGDTVVVYPEEKEFTDGEGIEALSLLPLEERNLWVDLSSYTPAEMSFISMDAIFSGSNKIGDTDKIVWRYAGVSPYGYNINESGTSLNLSYGTYNSDRTVWEMIVGEADQLASDNIRYNVELKITPSAHWVKPAVYTQDENGNRREISVAKYEYYDLSYLGFASYWADNKYPVRQLYITLPDVEMGDYTQAYVGLDFNALLYDSPRCSSLKISKQSKVGDGYEDIDITNQICNQDMLQVNAGELMSCDGNSSLYGISTYDADGHYIGYVQLDIRLKYSSNYGSSISFRMVDENGKFVVNSFRSKKADGCESYYPVLYKEYMADGIYYLKMSYSAGNYNDITAAYEGQYSSMAEAAAAGAADIKSFLFYEGSEESGYAGDYSKGIYFTVFEGEDGEAGQIIRRYCFQTENGTRYSPRMVTFDGLKRSDGTEVPCYIVPVTDDSYGEKNFCTILVGENEELMNLAPVFSVDEGVRLYTAGSGTPETSGASMHDFSNGAVMYTAAAENGKGAKNYWLQVLQARPGMGHLYINSLDDEDAHTREENGVIYSIREMMLDSYHYNWHDILLINAGTETIPNLSAELESDVVELDDYWTLSGNYGLAGFHTIKNETEHGQMPNFAQLRLRAKRGVEDGTEVSGTLTIKSGTTPLMVLTLTGAVGSPHIITEELPKELKCTLWVPYGTMIQNNNKYGWNEIQYSLSDGSLPAGMEMHPNGEIYGVPDEIGEFTFTVRMTNSAESFPDDTKTYTLVVEKNTDENVEVSTDAGYEIIQRVPDLHAGLMSTDSQTLVSIGAYEEFVDVYLDGEKLEQGRDYTSESGSTRITIQSQTLVRPGTAGTHTLGIEFRTKDTDVLKRAAQNYRISSDALPENGKDENGSRPDGYEDSGSDAAGQSEGGIAVASAAKAAVITASAIHNESVISYTVASGDTLWKIAEKFYGSGTYWQKIYADNADLIQNPDRIYAGQVILIYALMEDSAVGSGTEARTYTVEAGDNLWKIAQKIYGKGWYWRKIFQANADIIQDAENIYAGQVILIPEG